MLNEVLLNIEDGATAVSKSDLSPDIGPSAAGAAFFPSIGLLVIGVNDGSLTLWRRLGVCHPRKSTNVRTVDAATPASLVDRHCDADNVFSLPQHAWELVKRTVLASGVLSMAASATSRVAALSLSAGDVLLLQEAPSLSRAVAPVTDAASSGPSDALIAAVQIGVCDVAVEYAEHLRAATADGNSRRIGIALRPVAHIRSGLHAVRGCAARERCIALWSGRDAEIYSIQTPLAHVADSAKPPATGFAKREGAFPFPSASAALTAASTTGSGDVEMVLWGVSDLSLVGYTMRGAIMHTITMPDASGRPLLIDANAAAGRILAVATSRHCVRIYDTGPTAGVAPTFVAALNVRGRPVGDACEKITQIRINSAGDRVALLFASSVDSSASLEVNDASTCPKGADAVAPPPLTALSYISRAAARSADNAQVPDRRVLVWDAETDTLSWYDVGADHLPVAVAWDDTDPRLLIIQTRPVRLVQLTQTPVLVNSSFVDVEPQKSRVVARENVGKSNNEVVSLFSVRDADERVRVAAAIASTREMTAPIGNGCTLSAEGGIMQQDRVLLDDVLGDVGGVVVGLHAPFMVLATPPTPPAASGSAMASQARITLRAMRDYAGSEVVDPATQHALNDFGYFVALGDVDAANRAIAGTSLSASTVVWQNLARVCIATGRADIAAACFARMGDLCGAVAVTRSLTADLSPGARSAIVAVQLGRIGDAERLLAAAGPHDQLVSLRIASGRWKAAVDYATAHAPILLPSIHVRWARERESARDVSGAALHYAAAGVAVRDTEVPRMLVEAAAMEIGDSRRAIVTAYVDDECSAAADGAPLLRLWLGGYLESLGDITGAENQYRMAGEISTLVRLACSRGDVATAAAAVDAADSAGDAASASYRLARHYEAMGRTTDAVTFYLRAGSIANAVRLELAAAAETVPVAESSSANASDAAVITHGRLFQIACTAPHMSQLKAASYFEASREPGRAAHLYRLAGDIPRALALCFARQSCNDADNDVTALKDELCTIVDSLDAQADPDLLRRAAAVFVNGGDAARGVTLLINAGKLRDALDICVAHGVAITEAMAEAMTPPKPEGSDFAATSARTELLHRLGTVCEAQGSHALAAKKLTQAGDKVAAMRALLALNDVEKIVSYARVARDVQLFVMAALHLQATAAWSTDAEILKTIVDFFKRARAGFQLSEFYVACARVEICAS